MREDAIAKNRGRPTEGAENRARDQEGRETRETDKREEELFEQVVKGRE